MPSSLDTFQQMTSPIKLPIPFFNTTIQRKKLDRKNYIVWLAVRTDICFWVAGHLSHKISVVLSIFSLKIQLFSVHHAINQTAGLLYPMQPTYFFFCLTASLHGIVPFVSLRCHRSKILLPEQSPRL